MPSHTESERVNVERQSQNTSQTPVGSMPAGGPAHTTSTKSGSAPSVSQKSPVPFRE